MHSGIIMAITVLYPTKSISMNLAGGTVDRLHTESLANTVRSCIFAYTSTEIGPLDYIPIDQPKDH
jgi:hypothetical protein